jgi:hypothetical protein
MITPKYYYPGTFKRIREALKDDRVTFRCDAVGDICGFIEITQLRKRVKIILREDGFMIDGYLKPDDKIRVLEYLNEYFPSFRFVGDNKFISVNC